MFVILCSDFLKEKLGSQVLCFIGKISFSFYLLHFIILCSLTCYLFTCYYTVFSYNMAVILSFLSSIPLIVGTAIFYYQWIDRLGIIVSEKLCKLVKLKS